MDEVIMKLGFDSEGNAALRPATDGLQPGEREFVERWIDAFIVGNRKVLPGKYDLTRLCPACNARMGETVECRNCGRLWQVVRRKS